MPIAYLPVQPAPDWLIQMTPERMARDSFPLHDLLSRSPYYPSSSFVGDPIAYLGGNHLSFVYVDYGEERDGLLNAQPILRIRSGTRSSSGSSQNRATGLSDCAAMLRSKAAAFWIA